MENIWQWIETNQSGLLVSLSGVILLLFMLLLWQGDRYRKLEKRLRKHEKKQKN